MTTGSNSSIMSVGELIDNAFGEPEVNTVNHKLIQTVLYLLARQLRVLERRVAVNITPFAVQPSTSSLSVTEVKLHAMQKKKEKKGVKMKDGQDETSKSPKGMKRKGPPGKVQRGAAAAQGQKSSDKKATDRVLTDKASTDKTLTEDSSTAKSTTDKSSSAKTSSAKTSTDKSSTDKTSSTDKSSTDKTLSTAKSSTDKSSSAKTSSAKTSTDKSSTDKTSSTDKSSTDKTSSTDKSSTKTPTDKTTTEESSTAKTSTDKSSTDKTTTEESSTAKTSTDKSSTDKTSTDKTSTDKTSTDKTSTDKTSTDKTSSTDKSSTDKTSTDKTSTDKTSTDKTSSTDKSSTVKSSTDKSSSDKTATEESSTAKTTTDKSSTDKMTTEESSTAKTSTDKSSTDKTSSAAQTSSDKTSSTQTSSDKTSSAKTSSDKTSSAQTSSDKTSSSKTTSEESSSSSGKRDSKTAGAGKSGSAKHREDFVTLLEIVEVQREAELRVIHQRKDSREEHEKTPSPMASLDSMEATYEKLLVVERLPQEEAKALAGRGRTGSRSKTPRLSVVTQEQFEALAKVVRQIQHKFDPTGKATFPENIKLMSELRKGASLTDAMAALQLSARLEAAEKTLHNLLSLVTEMASKTPGVDISFTLPEGFGTAGGVGGLGGLSGLLGKKDAGQSKDDVEVLFGKKETLSQSQSRAQTQSGQEVEGQMTDGVTSEESLHLTTALGPLPVKTGAPSPGMKEGETEELPKDCVTFADLDAAMKSLFQYIIGSVDSISAQSTSTANNAAKSVMKLEEKIIASLNLGTRMEDLENKVTEYSEQINILDTGLSAQMTNYQEELTQMQHDLETGLETMAEVLASAGTDTTAVTELNTEFNNLQFSLENAFLAQKELKDTQDVYLFDLQALRKKIEILYEIKSDREEVADALRDKAGISQLNGLVSLQQFEAVQGELQKKIGAAYDKFNNQESMWQKIIDELVREYNDKADVRQVEGLRDEIAKHINNMNTRINALMAIVGEPKAAAVSKELFRDTACLSCATPAKMGLEEAGGIPALPAVRPPAIGAEATTPKEHGDHALCYPGLPIPHPIDPRAHVCKRWCGGSHTVITETVPKAPMGMLIKPALRPTKTELGTDGKLYKVDDPVLPIYQCLIRAGTPVSEVNDGGNTPDVTPPADFASGMNIILPDMEIVSVTPPVFEV